MPTTRTPSGPTDQQQESPLPSASPPDAPQGPDDAAPADDSGGIGLMDLSMDDLDAVDGEYDPELYDPELEPPVDITELDDQQIEQLVAEFGQAQVMDWYEKLTNAPNFNYPATEYDASGEPAPTEE